MIDFYDVVEWFTEDLFGFLLGGRNDGQKIGDDLILTLKRAHLGKLPSGQYAEQIVSAKTFSRDELRVPLDADTLHRMDACVTVRKHDVQLRTVSSKSNFRSQVRISLSLSLQFEGETAEGEKVSVNIGHALLMAYVERDKVRGMVLRTLKEVK